MSKQSEAKLEQGYVAKAVPKTCGNCVAFASTISLPEWLAEKDKERVARGLLAIHSIEYYGIESNLRCTIGNFAVKKMATCNKFKSKE